jgi:LuxR family transcriptional regulator
MYAFRAGEQGERVSLRQTAVPRKRTALALDLGLLAPAGHYLALRVGFAFPMEEVQALPPAWVEIYTQQGYMLADPIVRWGYESEGPRAAVRWSAIAAEDPRGVLETARSFGLRFGVAVAVRDEDAAGLRSFARFARSDREFEDEEMALLLDYVWARHLALCPPRNITPAEIEALRLIKDGLRLKQIAYQLGVTEGAVKQRLKSARVKLDAKTGAEAISRASSFGLI